MNVFDRPHRVINEAQINLRREPIICSVHAVTAALAKRKFSIEVADCHIGKASTSMYTYIICLEKEGCELQQMRRNVSVISKSQGLHIARTCDIIWTTSSCTVVTE